jgi:hypothetical protein
MDVDYQDINYVASVHPEIGIVILGEAKNLLRTREKRDSSSLSLLRMTHES